VPRLTTTLTIREQLEAILDATNWTQAELAREIGCSRQNVQIMIKAGGTGIGTRPSWLMGQSIARVYAEHVE
jgi:DNA-binding XRE family transcriptional regulator